MLSIPNLDGSTPKTIEHLTSFLLDVKDEIEREIPPRSSVNIKKNSDYLGEDEYGILYGYYIIANNEKLWLWFGIYFELWKRKGTPFCLQLINDQKDGNSVRELLKKAEHFCSVKSDGLSYFKDFDGYPTIGFDNKLILNSNSKEMASLLIEIMKLLSQI